jgi:hypothetical protein
MALIALLTNNFCVVETFNQPAVRYLYDESRYIHQDNRYFYAENSTAFPTEQMPDPPIVQTAETFPVVYSNIQPTRFDDNARRRSSMQEAADIIMGETFDFPGVASQAMLPPQPSRAYSQVQRTSSIGQPLQLMDFNQSVLPYTGKGKGRARDFDPVQQQRARDFDPNQQQQQVPTG